LELDDKGNEEMHEEGDDDSKEEAEAGADEDEDLLGRVTKVITVLKIESKSKKRTSNGK